MSTLPRGQADGSAVRARLAGLRRAALAVLFGDRLGLTLFCGTLFVLAVTMREAVFINDNYTVVNALVAVADGHLDVRRAAFGPGLTTPGMVETGGRVYGRNYGHVFLALPVLLVLRALATVADLRLLLAGAWVLLLLWTLRGVGSSFGRERAGTLLGSGLALVVFGGSVVTATALPDDWLPFLALQIVSLVAAGFLAVLCYRLVSDAYGGRVGVATGGAAALATGIGFWASIPKRHVLLAALVLAAAFLLYRSRVLAGPHGPGHADVRRRAGAYACVGLAAWVAAPQGPVLGLAVVAADLATARRDDVALRPLLVVTAVTVVSLLPLLLTNLAISGNPLAPPRFLPAYEGVSTGDAEGPTFVTDRGSSAGSGGVLTGIIGTLTGIIGTVFGQFLDGAAVAVTRPDRVVRTFVRTGYDTTAPSGVSDILGANLSVLEVAPLLAALAGTLGVGSRWVTGTTAESTKLRVVDVFVVAYALLLTLAYIPRLPLHATITVRYLVPMFPLLVYAVARLPAIRRVINHRWQVAAWTYTGTVLIGGQLFLAGTTLLGMGVGESMQAHAVVNLAVAGVLAGWAVAATRLRRGDTPDRYDDTGAVLLGLATGLGTVLVLLASVAYLPVGELLLPIVPAL